MGTLNLRTNAGGSVIFEPQNTATDKTVFVPAMSGTMATTDQVTAFRNRIINGDMRIDQRRVGNSAISNDDLYSVDRWMAQSGGGAINKYSVQQVTDAPAGFINSLKVTSLSAYAVSGADYADINQRIEGFNVADFEWGTANAKSITVSFWVKSSLTGSFGGAIRGAGFTRSYAFIYTISSANTWEYKTITIPGDTSGTWGISNGVGLQLSFGLGNGSTYTGAAGSWGNTPAIQASGTVSVIATNAATFFLTGVQLEVGTVATPFERRPYGTELALCQRYYFRQAFAETQTWGSGHAQTTNLGRILTQSPVPMRTTPSFSSTATNVFVYAGWNGSTVVANGVTSSGLSAIDHTGTNITIQATVTGIVGSGVVYGYNGYNEYSAEL